MPLLSSLGAASSHGWDHNTPVVTGGTLTADATYYYRTFTDHTSWNELKVSGGPVEMDVLVVGHGGDGGKYMALDIGTYWNYSYHGYGQCYYYYGECNCSYYDCYQCYWNQWDEVVCDYRYNYYADDSRTYQPHTGGGGAGGVATGKITVAPGIHLITVADRAGLMLPNNVQSMSTAFGIWTLNGGQFERRGANGVGMPFYSGSLEAMGIPLVGYSYPSPTTNSSVSYKPNESSSWGAVTSAPMVTANSYSILNTAGNAGSGDGTGFGYGAIDGQSYTIQNFISYGYLNSYEATDVIYYGGWGGGAGSAGYGAGAKSWVNNINDPYGLPIVSNNETSIMRFAPNRLVNGNWIRAGLAFAYSSNNIKSSIMSGAYSGTVGLYDADYGIGVEKLGLKVAGGGMGNRSARNLGHAYGGGYPGDSATTDPWGFAPSLGTPGFQLDEWDITPKQNGKPNTGGGGGGGTGGSGVVRVRYLRSAVGG